MNYNQQQLNLKSENNPISVPFDAAIQVVWNNFTQSTRRGVEIFSGNNTKNKSVKANVTMIIKHNDNRRLSKNAKQFS